MSSGTITTSRIDVHELGAVLKTSDVGNTRATTGISTGHPGSNRVMIHGEHLPDVDEGHRITANATTEVGDLPSIGSSESCRLPVRGAP